MKRRSFIGALIGLAIGGTLGSKLVAAEQKTDMAEFRPQQPCDVTARLDTHSQVLIEWGRPQMRVYSSESNGHVDRIWFDNEMVYHSAISKRRLENAISSALMKS